MKDEIKEILDYLKPKYDIVDELGNDYKKVKFKDCELLLDYITTLQKENGELKEINKEQANHLISKDNLSYEDYKARIDKAVEYIKCMPYLQEVDEIYEDMNGKDYCTYKEWNDSELLDILQGDDNNAKD